MAQAPKALSVVDPEARRRAPALSPDDRRQMIVDAVVPLLAEHGSDLTSRQIAEAAGVAEGTVFRAFGDKDTLLRAAAEQYFDEAVVLDELRAIDPTWALEEKLTRVVELMHRRFQGALRVMSVLGDSRPVGHAHYEAETARVIDELFEPDTEELAWPAARIMHAVRLLAFAASVPEISASDSPFSNQELALLLAHGIRRVPAGPRSTAAGAGS